MEVNKTEFVNKANHYGLHRRPFFFVIDFEMKKPLIWSLDKLSENTIMFDFEGITNTQTVLTPKKQPQISFQAITFEDYLKSYRIVEKALKHGDTYLVNLTAKTPIQTDFTQEEIYFNTKAKYKLLYKNHFVMFSPETFVKIIDNHIYTYPMKGTIKADIPDAEKIILNDTKELWEHNTIVDLLRNDLAIVANNIKVTRFRYIDTIATNTGKLLQVSSEIKGSLSPDWFGHIGEILIKLLPAGSISGAPKKKTIEVIQQAENYTRGYFTGISGIFLGTKLISAVNIRYIDTSSTQYFYHSGGGITAYSDPLKEYAEMKNKIYLPL